MSTQYLYPWPSPGYVDNDWIYDLNGAPAFYIQNGRVYNISGQQAYWIQGTYMYPLDKAGQPEFYFG
jgi:hypothetical protein